MTQVTLTLPDDLYREARRQAELRQQPLDTLLSDLLAHSIHEQIGESEDTIAREQSAYQAKHQMLRQQYAGHHVAIFQGELVDHDHDGVALSRRVYERFPNEFVLIRRVEDEPERILRFRSPRLSREA